MEKSIKRNVSLFMIGPVILALIAIFPVAKAYGLKGSADYQWGEKKVGGKWTAQFTQIYNLIFSRSLQPLYDTSLKFEFRSETSEKTKNRERSQLLPSLNMRLGHEMMNLNLGGSRDTILEEEGIYTNERIYASFGWRPKLLPQILIQYQGEKKDDNEGPSLRDNQISFKENYTLKLGLITLDHSFNQQTRDIEDEKKKSSTSYDLVNTANIGQRFSFFNNRLAIGTGYKFSHTRDMDDDGNLKVIKKTGEHNAHFNIIGEPAKWIKPDYKAFWWMIKTDQSDKPDEKNEDESESKKETSIGHNINLYLNPHIHPYLSSTFGMSYNGSMQSQEEFREVTTYSLNISPSIHGLIFDPNIPMYPINTSFLASRSIDKTGGSRQSHTLSFLLTGSITICQGADLNLDMGLTERENFITKSKDSEKKIDSHLNLDLLPTLKASVRETNEWTGDNYFNGSLETNLIYHPMDTLMLDAGYIIGYGNKESSYQYNFNWSSTSKLEFDIRHQSDTEGREKYFSIGFNANISPTIRLGLRYQYPTEDQLIDLQFTVRF